MAKMILLWFTLIRFILLRVMDLDASTFAMHQPIFLMVYFLAVATIALSQRHKFGTAS